MIMPAIPPPIFQPVLHSIQPLPISIYEPHHLVNTVCPTHDNGLLPVQFQRFPILRKQQTWILPASVWLIRSSAFFIKKSHKQKSPENQAFPGIHPFINLLKRCYIIILQAISDHILRKPFFHKSNLNINRICNRIVIHPQCTQIPRRLFCLFYCSFLQPLLHALFHALFHALI